MDLTFQPRKRARHRARDAHLTTTPAGGVTATVRHVDGLRFCWTFTRPYDDGGSDMWVAADFAGLWVGGLPPLEIDEVIGADGTLTLFYDVQDPLAPDLQFEVNAAPAVLRFDGDAPLAVPQNGFVTP